MIVAIMTGIARPATTTILFTDLVNSTEVLQRTGDEQGLLIQQAHFRVLRAGIAAHGGHEIKTIGDAFMVAFPSAIEAVACAIAMQQAARRPAAGERLQIRIGLNSGEAMPGEGDDLFGTPVVIASRLCAKASAGQILCGRVVAALLTGRQDFEFRDTGDMELKGISTPVGTCEVVYTHDADALLAHTPFVGRREQIASLHRQLDAARGGHGGLAMLVGEPGIGKTRTAEEFCEQARAAGATVLWGRCYEGEWAPPFSPFAEAIKAHVISSEPDALRADCAYGAGIIARIAPALREKLPEVVEAAPLQPDEERYRLLEGVSEFFGAIAARAPLVLVLDDLHWADKGTIAMLQRVARGVKARRMLILGGYRDVELDRQHPLAAALADLRRETPYERIDLKGLDAGDVGTLVDVIAEQDVPDALAAAISAETDGNPLFVRLVLVNLVDEGKVRREDGRWTSDASIAEMAIPEGIREVIGRRLSRLSEITNRLLTTASAMTGGFSWDVLRAISGEPEPALVDALDEALRAHVVEERREGRTVTYDFTHAMIRHTLYEELSTPRRIMLHRRIGEALEQLYARDIDVHLAELAYHFFEAAPGGDAERAIDYCRRAARRALDAAAYDEAVAHIERAIEAREMQPSDDRERCELLLELGEMQTAACYFATAGETFLRAADLARSLTDAHELFGRAALGYAGPMYAEVGALDVALPLLREAAAALAISETSTAALVMGRLSVWLLPTDPERAALISRAVDIARACGDAATLAQVLCYRLSSLRAARAEPEAQIAAADEVIAIGSAGGLHEQLTQAYAFRLYSLLERGEIAAVDAQLEDIGRLAARIRKPSYHWYHTGWSAMRAILDGRFDEGESLALKGLSIGQQIQNINAFFGFASQMFTLRWDQGRLSELEPALRSGLEQFPDVAINATALAFVLIEAGEKAEARAIFERVAVEDFASVANDGDATNLLLLAGICAALEDPERAAILYDLLLPFSGRACASGNAFAYAGAASNYLALLSATMQRWGEAEAHFDAAIELTERMGARPSVARTQSDYAAMLLQRGSAGDRERAVALLDASIATAEELGMASLLERARALR